MSPTSSVRSPDAADSDMPVDNAPIERHQAMNQRSRSVISTALLLLTAACSSSGGTEAASTGAATTGAAAATRVTSTPATSPTTTAATTTTEASTTATLAIAPGARYVAMGSSYAAGSGIPNQLEGPCGRSDANYPSLVSAALGLQLVDVSCGGAAIANLLDTPQLELPPQIDALTADTELVTITAGGNDLGYVVVAGVCGIGEAPCTVDEADIQTKATTLVADLQGLFDAIRERSPEAAIVFVTYPRLVTDTECPALNFEPAEVEAFDTVAVALQEAFLTAAAEQPELVLVDPYSASGDHGPCAPQGESWITGNAPVTGTRYHPTPAGHLAVSALIVEALGG